MTIELLFIACFAVYRLTIMLNSEHGPADIFGRFRQVLGVKYDEYSNPVSTGWISEGVLCYFCLSVWVGILLTLWIVLMVVFNRMDIAFYTMLPFAASGFAVFLKKWAG